MSGPADNQYGEPEGAVPGSGNKERWTATGPVATLHKADHPT